MSCGNCHSVAIPGSTICPECLLEDYQGDNRLDEAVLDRFTEEEIVEINERLEALDGNQEQ